MKISIIIPVFNGEKYIDRSISSIINQSIFKDIELIIINDGSTDNTKLICEKYANEFNNINIINSINKGVSSARNLGLIYASGDYVGFVDADDWVDKDMYSELYTIAKSTNAEVVFCNHIVELDKIQIKGAFITSTLQTYNREDILNLVIPTYISNFDMNSNKINFQMGSVCKGIFLRNKIINCKLSFDNSIKCTEDQIFILNFLKDCYTATYYNRCFYHYEQKQSTSSTTQKYLPSLINDLKLAEEKITSILSDLNLDKKLEKSLKMLKVKNIIWNFNNLLKKDCYYKYKEVNKIINEQIPNTMRKFDSTIFKFLNFKEKIYYLSLIKKFNLPIYIFNKYKSLK